MKKITSIMVAFMAFGLLTLGLTEVASAQSAGCGTCHGTAPIAPEVGRRTGFTNTPSYEDNKTPVSPDICNDRGRGLHGIHMNYSSVSYGRKSTSSRGNCNYCHNSHIHENGFVEFSGYNPVSALNSIKTATLASGGTGWTTADVNNTYVVISGGDGNAQAQITGVTGGAVTTFSVGAHGHSSGSAYSIANGVTATEVGGSRTFTVNITALNNYGLRQTQKSAPLKVSGTGIGANGLDITQMDGNATCATACHKGTSATNTAPWGNYTSPTVVLSCSSCHADLSGVSGTESALSGVHGAHLSSAAAVPSGTAMNAAANAGCVNCHTNNTGEGKLPRGTDDFGTVKAYPHASDGTNVVSDNVTLTGQITSATKAGTNTTCAAACHPRSNELTPAITWGSSMQCDMCHYYPGLASTDTGSGALPGAHELHITQGGIACSRCHPIPSDLAHVTAMPPSPTGVTFASDVNYNGGATLTGTCQNSCHAATSPSWSTVTSTTGCATCHNYPGATVGVGDWTGTTNGHTVRASDDKAIDPMAEGYLKHLNVATVYNALTDNYTSVTNNVNKCGLCHKGATHMNGTKDVADNNNNGTSCSTTFTFTPATTISTPPTTHSNAKCSNAKCHFGRTTPNWN